METRKQISQPKRELINSVQYSDNEKCLEIESMKLQILAKMFATKPKKKDDADTNFVLSFIEPLKKLSSLHKM